MADVLVSLVWAALRALPYSVPVVLSGSELPRRSHFAVRAVACYLVMTLYMMAQPQVSLTTTTLSGEQFMASALYFTGILALNVGLMYACHDTTPQAAAFCSVVGYTLENLGSGLATFAGLMANNPDSTVYAPQDLLLTRAFWCTLVYVTFVLTVVSEARDLSFSVSSSKTSFSLVLSVVLFNIVFDMIVKQLYHFRIPMGYSVVLRVVQVFICVFSLMLEYQMLLVSHVEDEAAALERMMQARVAQYELSRKTIESVNVKMHDIRHQIRHLGTGEGGTAVVGQDVLDDIARGVRVYDTRVKTGNDALDTIITEKALLGEREGITLSCIADGAALDFMSPADLYALFGNALENAFEAVRKVDDPDRRNIALQVRRAAGMVSIHVENYFQGEVEFAGGLPRTSKADAENHGLGTKSMQLTAERYGGALTVRTEGQTYHLNVLIPIP